MENITGYLYDYARLNPMKPALLYPKRVTFMELCRLTDNYAAGFQRSGILKGTKTIVLLTPGLNLFAVVFALLRIGAMPVLIDPGMGNKAMARALSGIDAGAFVGIAKAHLLRIFYPEAFRTAGIFVSASKPLFRNDFSLKEYRKSGNFSFDVCTMNASDEVAVFFTSGSTGPAKAVVYKHYMLEAQIQYLKDHFKYSPDDIDLCTFPLIGLLVINLGISIVLADMDMTHPATLKPRKLIRNVSQFGCSCMFCSPMVLQKITRFATPLKLKLPSLKKVFTAGAPVTPALLRNFRKLLPAGSLIHTPFGSTEALSVTDALDVELLSVYGDSDSYLNGICVGTPLKDISIRLIKITDDSVENIDDLEKLRPGDVGEISVYGPNVTQSYLNNDHANKISKMKDSHSTLLWHRTGDLGRMDISGRLWYYGRKSQRVETGKAVYFTIPCEAVFNQHPDVSRSALLGVRLNGGLAPVICIELKKGIRKSDHLIHELLALAKENESTGNISVILFHRNFPVDPRHNAKIFREKLVVWAQNQLK